MFLAQNRGRYSSQRMSNPRLKLIAQNLELGSYARHILLCVGGDCAPRAEQDRSWHFLKKRLAELELVDVRAGVYRSKVECLRICRDDTSCPGCPERPG